LKAESLRAIVDWVLLILIIGSIMYLGKIRMHQITLNRFLLLNFGIIVCLIIIYRAICIRFFLPGSKGDSE